MTKITEKLPQRDRGRRKIGQMETAIFIRLAAIPQPLADDLPLSTVHQAAPKTAANTMKSVGASRRRSRKVCC
jgi:hypothetical protein